MDFDVAANDTAQRPDEFIDLSGVCAADRVGNTDSVDTDLIYSLVDREEVDEVGPERVLGGESNLNALGLDKVDDLDRGFGDVGHILTVRELS